MRATFGIRLKTITTACPGERMRGAFMAGALGPPCVTKNEFVSDRRLVSAVTLS
jgi:hypothetical protein